MLKTLFIIGMGSFTGGILRYLLTRWMHPATFITFPTGTFLVNIMGCFAIGLFYGFMEKGSLMNINLRLFLTVGLCGGFTTFSTFMNENFELAQEGNFLYLCLYTGLSLFVGFAMLYFGHLIVKLV